LYCLSSIQVEKWSEHPRASWNHFYLFIGLLILSSFFAFFRILILVLTGFKQSDNIHKSMIKSLLYASIPDFFNRVPIGRIINRLTKDLRIVD
jgi:ATP-binding cassette subfamily C (CFTR/MRP) protein 1